MYVYIYVCIYIYMYVYIDIYISNCYMVFLCSQQDRIFLAGMECAVDYSQLSCLCELCTPTWGID